MSKDYCNILGVEKGATEEEIKKAFRKKAHKLHPDKKDGNEAQFKEVNEAYQILGDETKRKKYDQFGSNFDQQGGFGGGAGWEDFMHANRGNGGQGGQSFNFQFGGEQVDLGDIFGSMFGFGNSNRPRKGSDVQVDVEVTLKEAISGLEKDIHFFIQTKNGREERKFSVNIPAGIDSGQSIRVSGKGQPSPNGGPNGDVYMLIHVKPDLRFARQGSDIFTELTINFVQAVLGETIEIETIDGRKKLIVPPGSTHGQQIRLKGEGMPKLHGRGKGDQYVKILIDIPKRPNRKMKNVLKELEELL